jgi:hypothetical protein
MDHVTMTENDEGERGPEPVTPATWLAEQVRLMDAEEGFLG